MEGALFTSTSWTCSASCHISQIQLIHCDELAKICVFIQPTTAPSCSRNYRAKTLMDMTVTQGRTIRKTFFARTQSKQVVSNRYTFITRISNFTFGFQRISGPGNQCYRKLDNILVWYYTGRQSQLITENVALHKKFLTLFPSFLHFDLQLFFFRFTSAPSSGRKMHCCLKAFPFFHPVKRESNENISKLL